MKKRTALRNLHFSAHLLKTLHYFAFFSYAPKEAELYLFHSRKMSSKVFKKRLQTMVVTGKIKKYDYNGLNRYTVGGYGSKEKNISLEEMEKRIGYSQRKMTLVKPYLSILARFPQIKFIGFSGSVSMMHAKKDDDIDLFLITEKGRMFTGRFIGLFLAILMGLKRKRRTKKASDKVCLNLFFDLSQLDMPYDKRTEYVAHEVLQMKPVVDKDNTYAAFRLANRWVEQWYPNSAFTMAGVRMKKTHGDSYYRHFGRLIEDGFEWIMRTTQLFFISKHSTHERITPTQLWFFPDDFEKKLRRK